MPRTALKIISFGLATRQPRRVPGRDKKATKAAVIEKSDWFQPSINENYPVDDRPSETIVSGGWGR